MLLLDTHMWIWWVNRESQLGEAEHRALSRAASSREVAISAISMWEAQLLHQRDRLELDVPFETWLVKTAAPSVVKVMPLDVAVVLALHKLPPSFHGDPADRIIVATARAYDLPFATRDRAIRRSRAVRLWSA